MKSISCLAILFVFIFGGCSSENKSTYLTPITSNPNRMPPGKYFQSASVIPTAINDPFYSTAAPWASSSSPSNGMSQLSYLWSYRQLDVFKLYSYLKLPDQELIVAVLDTGVDKDHEDLLGRLWVNQREALDGSYDNHIDDDGNGFVDDSIGWDFVNNTNNPADDFGHGTHVSGTIAALGNNSAGIIGVAPWVRIMALKVCNESGACRGSDIRAAMSYAVQNGAKIINLSLGMFDRNWGSESIAFDNAVREAMEANVLVVTAAGNAVPATDASFMTPANSNYSLTVGAHRNDDTVCSFSNFGWKLDVSAPGCGIVNGSDSAGILSLNSKKCGPSGDAYCSQRNTVDSKYVLKSGTSMSTPHVAGMAAVAWTSSPDATALQIRQAVLRTARPLQSNRKSRDFGSGKTWAGDLSGINLITEAQTAPGLKIISPRYGSLADKHLIQMRIEARHEDLTYVLRYIENPSGSEINLTSGVPIFSDVVAADEHVTIAKEWTPPESGSYVLVLEASNAHQPSSNKYYDVSLVRR